MQTRRYDFIPVISVILQVIALLLFLYLMYQSIQNFSTTVHNWKGGPSGNPFSPPAGPVNGFGPRLVSLLPSLVNLLQGIMLPAIIWGVADLFLMVRDLLLASYAKMAGVTPVAATAPAATTMIPPATTQPTTPPITERKTEE